MPRATTMALPSGVQTGWMYSEEVSVRRVGAPPAAGTVQRYPFVSSQEV